jgi:hypothetical protein
MKYVSLCADIFKQMWIIAYSTYLYLLISHKSFGISYFKFSDIVSALNKVRGGGQYPSLSVEFMWVQLLTAQLWTRVSFLAGYCIVICTVFICITECAFLVTVMFDIFGDNVGLFV